MISGCKWGEGATYLLDVEDEEVEAEERLECLHALLELELPPVAQPVARDALREQLQPALALFDGALAARRLAYALEDLRLEVYLEYLAPGV